MQAKIKMKRGTTAQWALNDPILADGEPGWDSVLRVMRVGNGILPWSELPSVETAGDAAVAAAVTAAAAATSAAASAVLADDIVADANFDSIVTSIDADAASDFRVQQDERKPNTITPLAYGAAGDDTADDTAALNTTFTNAASLGLDVDGRGLTYKTTAQVNIPAGVEFTNAVIHCTASGVKILNFQGSDITLDSVKIIGRHATATAFNGEYAIDCAGPSAAAPFTNITIRNCGIERVGMYGIALTYVDGFEITDNTLTNVGYAGVGCTSALNGVIGYNEVDTIPVSGVFADNGYGIFLSRNETNSLITDPHSANVRVVGNRIHGIPWEGLDTHGGVDLTFANNIVTGCGIGIAIGGSDNASNATVWAPKNVTVVGNVIDSLVTDGTAKAGISLAGAGDALGTNIEGLTGIVSNNIIRNHGLQSDPNTGAIRTRNSAGLVISDNLIINPSPFGICVLNDNYGIAVTGNVVVDQWSSTVASAAVIAFRAGYSTGVVTGNVHRNDGGKTGATYSNVRGLENSLATSMALQVIGNRFEECALPLNSAGGAVFTQRVTSNFIGQAAFNGSVGTPGLTFGTDADTGFYPISENDFGLAMGGIRKVRFLATSVTLEDGHNLEFGNTTGSLIGTGATQKMGFYGATPIVRPTATPGTATDPATTMALVNDLRAKLISIGLIS